MVSWHKIPTREGTMKIIVDHKEYAVIIQSYGAYPEYTYDHGLTTRKRVSRTETGIIVVDEYIAALPDGAFGGWESSVKPRHANAVEESIFRQLFGV